MYTLYVHKRKFGNFFKDVKLSVLLVLATLMHSQAIAIDSYVASYLASVFLIN